MNIDEQLELEKRKLAWPRYFQSVEYKKRFVRCINREVTQVWAWHTKRWVVLKQLDFNKLTTADSYRLVEAELVEQTTGYKAKKARWFVNTDLRIFSSRAYMWRMFGELHGEFYVDGEYVEPSTISLSELEMYKHGRYIEISQETAEELMNKR